MEEKELRVMLSSAVVKSNYKINWTVLLKADSHIACHAHAVPLPLRVQNVSLQFDLHSAAVSDSHLPCCAHAMRRPCRSSQGHGTAQHRRRETACGLLARVQLLPATTQSSTKVVIRSIPILLTTIHTYNCKEW
jgi:hypothetical protein